MHDKCTEAAIMGSHTNLRHRDYVELNGHSQQTSPDGCNLQIAVSATSPLHRLLCTAYLQNTGLCSSVSYLGHSKMSVDDDDDDDDDDCY